MSSEDKATQLRVGIFMAIGLLAVGALVVYFGRLGDGFRKYYTIRVEYPNASGLFKDVGVLLAGAKIGLVENDPVILPDMNGVYVNLRIYENVEIPSASEFTVGSSGLLGDKFVQVKLLKDAKSSPPIKPGTVIKGKDETGFADIVDQAGPIIGEVREAVKKIDGIAATIQGDVLKKSTTDDLAAAVANLKATSASFAEASKKIDDLVVQAGGAVKGGEATFASAKGASDELKKTLVDVRALLQQAKQGNGALGVLLTDKEVANNLRALVANLKRNGILWYKDKSAPPDPAR